MIVCCDDQAASLASGSLRMILFRCGVLRATYVGNFGASAFASCHHLVPAFNSARLPLDTAYTCLGL
jgi:hypothetical protein